MLKHLHQLILQLESFGFNEEHVQERQVQKTTILLLFWECSVKLGIFKNIGDFGPGGYFFTLGNSSFANEYPSVRFSRRKALNV